EDLQSRTIQAPAEIAVVQPLIEISFGKKHQIDFVFFQCVPRLMEFDNLQFGLSDQESGLLRRESTVEGDKGTILNEGRIIELSVADMRQSSGSHPGIERRRRRSQP